MWSGYLRDFRVMSKLVKAWRIPLAVAPERLVCPVHSLFRRRGCPLLTRMESSTMPWVKENP